MPGSALDDCPALFDDEVEPVVRWTSGARVGKLAGQPLRLRFELTDVYATQFHL